MKRRHLFGSLLLAGASRPKPAEAQETAASIDSLCHVAAAHGVRLTDDRIRILGPVLKNRQAQLNALRAFAIDDKVAPTPGIAVGRPGK